MKKHHAYLINIVWSEEDRLFIAEVPELEKAASPTANPRPTRQNAPKTPSKAGFKRQKNSSITF